MGLLTLGDHGELIGGVLPSRRTSHSTPRSTLLLFSQNSHQQQRDNQRNTLRRSGESPATFGFLLHAVSHVQLRSPFLSRRLASGQVVQSSSPGGGHEFPALTCSNTFSIGKIFRLAAMSNAEATFTGNTCEFVYSLQDCRRT